MCFTLDFDEVLYKLYYIYIYIYKYLYIYRNTTFSDLIFNNLWLSAAFYSIAFTNIFGKTNVIVDFYRLMVPVLKSCVKYIRARYSNSRPSPQPEEVCPLDTRQQIQELRNAVATISVEMNDIAHTSHNNWQKLIKWKVTFANGLEELNPVPPC